MAASALLIVSTSTLRRPVALRNHLCAINGTHAPRLQPGSLYVQFLEYPKPILTSPLTSVSVLSQITKNFYEAASLVCPLLDVRFVLKPWTALPFIVTSRPIQKVYIDPVLSGTHEEQFTALQTSGYSTTVEYLPVSEADEKEIDVSTAQQDTYSKVAIGGTFDRIHNGHKILLTEAVLRCVKEIIVGVTDENMLSKKLLSELIEPLDLRIRNVTDFLKDIQTFQQSQSNLSYRVIPISDPFGPTITEPDLELIIVSQETVRGAEKINQIRAEKKFQPMKVHVIEISGEPNKCSSQEEDKISSSSKRLRLLGQRLRPPLKNPSLPYIIGLTGGIASGKTTICQYLLEKHNFPVINCDKLGHQAYTSGTECFKKIVEQFGSDILDGDGQNINRRALGAKVFGKPEELKKLTDIVWPEIRRLANLQISELSQAGHEMIIVDAAVLLEASWQDFCHEIWVAFIPPEEAVKRIQARDNLSVSDAEKRISSQLSNSERLSHATFAFCSLWEKDFTRSQVDKAVASVKSVIHNLVSTGD